MRMTALLRVRGASQIVQVCTNGEKVLRGAAMKEIAVLEGEGGRGVGVVVSQDGRIAAVGCVLQLLSYYAIICVF